MKQCVNTLNLTIKESSLIEIESIVNKGMMKFIITGNIDKTIREARSKIISSFKTNSLKFPYGTVITNLSPADQKKSGSHYDLPIAISILSNQFSFKNLGEYIICGELGIDGSLKSVFNPIRFVNEAKKLGFKKIIIPFNELNYNYLFGDIEIIELKSIKEVINYLRSKELPSKYNKNTQIEEFEEDFSINDILSQESLIRALIIAIAGKHHILIKGPVGSGKTISIKSLNSIFPKLNAHQSLIISDLNSRIYNNESIIKYPNTIYPKTNLTFRELYGTKNKLGIIAESNFGFLIFDEINLFSANILNSLKALLDNDEVLKSNARKYIDYPVDFCIIATMNPCPCGKLGTNSKCECTLSQIERHNKKIDRALLDRFHIKISIDAPETYQMINENSYIIEKTREIIEKAQKIQEKRYKNDIFNNGMLNSKSIRDKIVVDNEIKELLTTLSQKYKLSIRASTNIIKIAQTIADLDGDNEIKDHHILEALRYQNL